MRIKESQMIAEREEKEAKRAEKRVKTVFLLFWRTCHICRDKVRWEWVWRGKTGLGFGFMHNYVCLSCAERQSPIQYLTSLYEHQYINRVTYD